MEFHQLAQKCFAANREKMYFLQAYFVQRKQIVKVDMAAMYWLSRGEVNQDEKI